ncbi:phytanoyl-CoA dioxygenase family protein [Thalassospira sp. MCCC 1A02491]|uniref:phytanoyl-CoA dioxygenase family protein n=1 Tax=Thalassospira sp. MCCC 1A02491 TaxID=1769751 RepID=UPI0009ECF1FF|nr:phytanoyl-CoA dioxygenase family protein [Thalassospira sp. MCCC 1A02491]
MSMLANAPIMTPTMAPNSDRPGNASTKEVSGTQLRDLKKKLPLRVLSEDDFAHWQTYGYVVVPNAVPAEQVKATVDLLWEFEEMDPNDPESWGRPQMRDNAMKELNNSGMVEIYNHQTLWDNRQTQRVYDAFVDIWDRTDLWVSIDRANLNTPNKGTRAFDGFIHWDADTSADPLPINVQGVLSLVDTTDDMGGFQCVPDLFANFEEWRKTAPADRDPFRPDMDTVPYTPKRIAMKAGDLVIFNSLLAHGIRANRSDQARIAQYISMAPATPEEQDLVDWRVKSWSERLPARGYAFPGDPRNWEQTRYERAKLTPLGEKLLGKTPW